MNTPSVSAAKAYREFTRRITPSIFEQKVSGATAEMAWAQRSGPVRVVRPANQRGNQ